jgi:nicotinate dehydrogenase subunit B
MTGPSCAVADVRPDGATIYTQGISRALHEEVTWDEHQVTGLDWSTYHILTFPEVPTIEVAMIDRPEEDALGAGEPAICPMVAAVGNAIFDATGVRLRRPPFIAERVLAALGTTPSA